MIRKFALLATMAAFIVACGGATEENMEAKQKAAADSAAAAQAKIEADMKAQQAIDDSLAKAAQMVNDTVKTEAAPAGH